MTTDIIIHPGQGPERLRKGRLIRTSLDVVVKAKSLTAIEDEERLIARVWPDWSERICELINLRIGPCNDPSKLYKIPAGRVIESALMWAGVKGIDMRMIGKVCEFMSGRLNLNPEAMNQPHQISPREICKSTLLWILAECGRNAIGFTRGSLPGQPSPPSLN